MCGMLCAPSTAWADGIFTPFVGGSFASDDTDNADNEGVRDGGFGVDVGGGLMGFLGESVGVRIDVRHVRTVKAGRAFATSSSAGCISGVLSVGLALRF